MKIKTSITIIAGCLFFYSCILCYLFFSQFKKKRDYVASFKGSDFNLTDMNNNSISQESFSGDLTAIFFGFTHCPDICPMTLNKLDLIMNELKKIKHLKYFLLV